MSERALARNDFGLKTEWWSTQIGEILASGVETRTFVELKLGDLSTVPCVIAKLEVALLLNARLQNPEFPTRFHFWLFWNLSEKFE